MAALRQQVKRHLQGYKKPIDDTPIIQDTPEQLQVNSGDDYEERELIGTSAAFIIPRYKDKRWWIRWPAYLWRTSQNLIPQRLHYEHRPASYWWSRWFRNACRSIRTSDVFSSMQKLHKRYTDVLVVFVPLAIVAAAIPWSSRLMFAFDFLAVVSLSGLVHTACEDISAHTNKLVGKLLVAFSNNIVELVVGIVALTRDEIALVQRSMLGSTLCYALLIMGSCFLFHGLRYREGGYNKFAVQSRGSLILIAISFLVILAIPDGLSGRVGGVFGPSLKMISHAMAICLLVFYSAYLFFETRSHAFAYDEDYDHQDDENADAPTVTSVVVLHPASAGLLLIVCLVGIAYFARALISNLSEHTFNMNKTFIGFIIFPFLGNVTDYLSACNVAARDYLDITLSATLGSSMGILLFTLPVLEILGWIIDKPMTLQCPPFDIAAVFFSVLVNNTVVQTAKSNYLSGAMCISLYAIIALAAYVSGDL